MTKEEINKEILRQVEEILNIGPAIKTHIEIDWQTATDTISGFPKITASLELISVSDGWEKRK